MTVVLVERHRTETLTVNRKRETKSPVFTSNVLLMQPSTRDCFFLGVQSPQKGRGCGRGADGVGPVITCDKRKSQDAVLHSTSH